MEGAQTKRLPSPHLEAGYTPIAHGIIEDWILNALPRQNFKIALAVIRKTYGFHCKKALISNKEFMEMTGMLAPNICREIKRMETAGILIVDRVKGYGNIYEYNKYSETWTNLPLRDIFLFEPIIRSDNKSLSERITPIRYKDNVNITTPHNPPFAKGGGGDENIEGQAKPADVDGQIKSADGRVKLAEGQGRPAVVLDGQIKSADGRVKLAEGQGRPAVVLDGQIKSADGRVKLAEGQGEPAQIIEYFNSAYAQKHKKQYPQKDSGYIRRIARLMRKSGYSADDLRVVIDWAAAEFRKEATPCILFREGSFGNFLAQARRWEQMRKQRQEQQAQEDDNDVYEARMEQQYPGWTQFCEDLMAECRREKRGEAEAMTYFSEQYGRRFREWLESRQGK